MSFDSLLVHQITLYTTASSQNELGEWVLSHTASESVDARVMPLTDEERMAYAGRYENANLKIYVPFTTAIRPGDRISYDNADYYVNEVVWDSSHTYKKIIASKL